MAEFERLATDESPSALYKGSIFVGTMSETTVSAIRMVIQIGSTFSEVITWRDAAGVLVPLPGGTTAEAKVRPYLYSDEVILRFSTTPTPPNDGLITLTSPGVTTLSLTSAQTAVLTPAIGLVFDLRYVFAGPNVVVKLDNRQGFVDIRGVSTRT